MVSKFSNTYLRSLGLWVGITAISPVFSTQGSLVHATEMSNDSATVTQVALSQQIPQRPDYYVLDQAKVLDGRYLHAIESLLTEHDRLTNEQIMLAIFKKVPVASNSSQDSTLTTEKQYAQNVFSEWKIGKRHYNEGALLTIFLDSSHAYLNVGYGLEAKLPENHVYEILDDAVIAQLHHHDPKAAAIWGAYRILELLVSPLIQNGKALDILKQDGIPSQFEFSNPLNDAYDLSTGNSVSWLLLLLLGISLLAFVFYQILSREAQFTAEGWYLDYPWSKKHSLGPSLKKSSEKFQGGSAHGFW